MSSSNIRSRSANDKTQSLSDNKKTSHEDDVSIAATVLQNTYKSGTAIAVQVGLLILTISILYGLFSHPINYYFVGLPILNTFGFVALAQSLLVTQPTPVSATHKTMSGQIHGILNSISVILFLGGFSLIYYNKHINNASHITTWHALFGVITYGLLVGALLGGIAQFWVPVQIFGSVNKGKAFYKYHRMAGYLVLVMTSLTTLLSLKSNYNVNVLHISFWSVLPAIGLIIGGLFTGIKLAKLGF